MLFSLFFLVASFLAEARWTEEDEAQRIAMINEMDLKAFESSMNTQQIKRRQMTYANDQGSPPIRGQTKWEDTRPKMKMAPSVDGITETEQNWCYHCTSPIGHLSEAMKKTIKDFLTLRRTSYPMEVSTKECINAKNFTLLHKQNCKHRYCQTMSIVDHDESASFVLRGCAENFGAIDTKTLDAQKENICKKLHKQVDIRECICKERKYCYANERRLSSPTSLWGCFLVLFLLVV